MYPNPRFGASFYIGSAGCVLVLLSVLPQGRKWMLENEKEREKEAKKSAKDDEIAIDGLDPALL